MLLIILLTFALSLYAQWKVGSNYRRYSQVPASSGYTVCRLPCAFLISMVSVTSRSTPRRDI